MSLFSRVFTTFLLLNAVLLGLWAQSAAAESDTSLDEYRVVIFSNDPIRAGDLMYALGTAGFTNAKFRDKPADAFTVKWGHASGETIDTLLAITSKATEIAEGRFKRDKAFNANDKDIFIHLPFAPHEQAGADYSQNKLVIFTNDEEQAAPLMQRLRAMGYTQSHFNAPPNSDINIKWGSASNEQISAIAAAISETLGVSDSQIARKPVFEANDSDIFINLPFEQAPMPSPRVEPHSGSAGDAASRADYNIVIFSDDLDRARSLERALSARGYRNVSSQTEPNDDFNIKWGHAGDAMIDEIIDTISDTTGIAAPSINRKDVFKPNDRDIFINLPFSSSAMSSPPQRERAQSERGNGRSDYRVVIFSDDHTRAQQLEQILQARGYTNTALRSGPNDHFNIKWGHASEVMIDELIGLIGGSTGIAEYRIQRSHEFESADHDIFINLPFSTDRSQPMDVSYGRADYRVVIFSNDRSRARTLERALQDRGYTNTALREGPNRNFNIKWGHANEVMVDEIIGLISDNTGVADRDISRLHEFQASDRDIFINLPFAF